VFSKVNGGLRRSSLMEPARHIIKSAEAKRPSRFGWVIGRRRHGDHHCRLAPGREPRSASPPNTPAARSATRAVPRRRIFSAAKMSATGPLGVIGNIVWLPSRRMVVGTGPPRHGDGCWAH